MLKKLERRSWSDELGKEEHHHDRRDFSSALYVYSSFYGNSALFQRAQIAPNLHIR